MIKALHITAIFLPLFMAGIVGFWGSRIGDRASQILTCFGILVSAGLSLWIFNDVALHGRAYEYVLSRWIESGDFHVNWAIKIDALTSVMLVVVTLVSSMVHVYSVGYMSHDKSIPRFMSYLSLFTFFMLMLVTSNNLLQMFFGWEGVGLASYLLINFWYEKESANRAAIKAFLVNRVGDFGFVLGIFATFMAFGSVNFADIFAKAPLMAEASFMFMGYQVPVLTTICLLLFVGAMGKSAQVGLHTWLPDAMEGPTPVSALIHAATMVTAGVFMIARLSPVYEYAPVALMVVTLVGAVTCIVAATIGMTQFDIKRVIAYSTMSQLGYMFFAAGVSAYSAAMFHLMTHAFFKALLFLGAGSVIHAMSGEQDMRKMGGIWRKIPMTYIYMWLGSLALAGIGIDGFFGFAGFYSKDDIIGSAEMSADWFGHLAAVLGMIVACITAFYSWRLLIMVFHGPARADAKTMKHLHESPMIMLLPLIPLALGAVFAGFYWQHYFVGLGRMNFWNGAIFVLPSHDVLAHLEELTELQRWMPILCAALGLVMAYIFYWVKPEWPKKVSVKLGMIYRLVYNKYYFDEIYDTLFTRPAFYLGNRFWQKGDEGTIDAYGPVGIARLSRRIGRLFQTMQTGYVYHYAFAMMLGLVLTMIWLLVRS